MAKQTKASRTIVWRVGKMLSDIPKEEKRVPEVIKSFQTE